MAEKSGWANLGAAFGGDSEEAYQEGRFMGARTEAALAEAQERASKNAARQRNEQNFIAAGVKPAQAKMMADAVIADADLGSLFGGLQKQQEIGFREEAAAPDTPLDRAQRLALAWSSGPTEPLYKVGGGYANKFDTEKGLTPLGDAFAADSGGDSSFIQNARAFGLIDPNGRVTNPEVAYEILRNTDKVFDVGGVPQVRTGNPFAVRAAAPAPAPAPAAPVAPPAAPAPAAPAAPAAGPAPGQLATPQEVADNKRQIAAATERGQAEGRNAAGLESTFATLDKFETDINAFMNMPGFDKAYGNWQGSGPGSVIMGLASQDAANAQAALESLGGEAFLASIQKMRGFGQLSNQEGAKVQTALTRAVNAKIGSDEARRAWEEVKLHLNELRRVAQVEAGQAQAAPGGDGWQTINGVRIRVKPQ